MIEIKGLKNGKAEYWDNEEGIKDFLKQNRGIVAPYLERMYMNFELALVSHYPHSQLRLADL